MINREAPANAQEWLLWCDKIGECPTLGGGLTKREYTAIHLSVELENIPIRSQEQLETLIGRVVDQEDFEDLVKAQLEAVAVYRRMYADVLFNELEKP